MRASEMIGKGVLDKNANSVGSVVDIEVSFPQWSINHIVVRVGLIKKLTVGIDKIDKIGDKVILKLTKDELMKGSSASQ